MKIFIGGSKMISDIDENVREKLDEIIKNKYDVLIGDYWGIDAAVQKFFAENDYHNVTVYATGDKIRNNIGAFDVCNVASDGAEGFEFYRQKDIAMARDADCGFMIWDKKSKGTLNNIIDLSNQKKSVEVYLCDERRFKRIDGKKTFDGIKFESYEDVVNAIK